MVKGRKPTKDQVKRADKVARECVDLSERLTSAMCEVVSITAPVPEVRSAVAAEVATNLIGAAICGEQEGDHRRALLLEILDSVRRHANVHGFNVVTTVTTNPKGTSCKKNAVMKIITMDELKKLDINELVKKMEASPLNQAR